MLSIPAAGIWGGKWCNSSFDPPPLEGAALKRACPAILGVPVPAIQPVKLPAITSLANGTIRVSVANHSVPLSLKARSVAASVRQQPMRLCRAACLGCQQCSAVHACVAHLPQHRCA